MEIIDPVCKMTIKEVDAAGTSSHGETIYYFCSKACKDKFDENPEAFIGEESSGDRKEISGTGEIFTCPMHPEVRQEGPGSCPKCGMALELVAPSITSSKTD
jgi:Cu+-exporting ATPase